MSGDNFEHVTIADNQVTTESTPVVDPTTQEAAAPTAASLSHEEKMAITNASRYLDQFLKDLEDLNGQAAKRVLAALVMPGTDWRLHKHTTTLEKNLFILATKLMDSKIIMMLAALEKAEQDKLVLSDKEKEHVLEQHNKLNGEDSSVVTATQEVESNG